MRKWIISLLLVAFVSLGSGILTTSPVPVSGQVTPLDHGTGA